MDAATLAGVVAGIRSLVRVLTNSEAFRDIHSNSESDTIEPGRRPLLPGDSEKRGRFRRFKV